LRDLIGNIYYARPLKQPRQKESSSVPLFRQEALRKLSNPERLDALMEVTTRKGWIALIAAAMVLVAAVAWGFLGSTPEQVAGSGILLAQGGIFDIETRGGGVLTETHVDVNDQVREGQVVARVEQPDTELTIRQLEVQLQELQVNRRRSEQLVNANRDAQLQSIAQQREQLAAQAESLVSQVAFLEQRVAAQQQALDLGLLTPDQLNATQQELDNARQQQVANRAQRDELDALEATARNAAEQAVFTMEQQAAQIQRQLQLTRERYEQETQVVSPYTGRVVSLLVDSGETVNTGTAVMNVELAEVPVEALAFIPLQGTRIRPGMDALLSPEGITWEEYGYMVGDVVRVSDAPINPDAMNRLLRNPTLVTQFTEAGGAYLVTIEMVRDSQSPSGFQWTSRQGPPMAIGSGTLFTVLITVQERRPIELVVPAFRRWLGI
jgi:HlyD family secretion protein